MNAKRLLTGAENILIIAIVILSASSCKAQEDLIVQAPENLSSIKEKLIQLVSNNEIPSMAIAVAKNGQMIWQESFGYADMANKIKASPNTIYAIGSMSKSISSTAIMTLAEAGKLSLEDKVNDLISPLELQSGTWDTDEVKLWHLLNMSAGLPHGWASRNIEFRKEHNDESFFESYGSIVFPPGTINHYSNFSIGVTEPIIEKVSGQDFSEYIIEAVFEPLNMHNSLPRYDESRSEEIAKQYSSKMKLVSPYDFYPINSAGHFASATDLVKYGNSFLNFSGANKVLKNETIHLMHNFDKGPKGIFRLGWGRMGDLLITNGGISGANSCLILIPSENLVVVCLTNFTSNNSISDQIAFEIVQNLAPNSLDMSLMGEFEETFRTPYQSTKKLAGQWSGLIKSIEGQIPVKLNFKDDGEITIQIGEMETKNLQSPIFNKVNVFEGSFKGIVPVRGYNPEKEVSINLTLHLDQGQLSGYLAPSFRNENGSFSYAAPLVLRKK